MGGGAITLLLIAVIITAVFFTVRGIIRYMRRRDSDRKEMLDLMRKQNRRDGDG